MESDDVLKAFIDASAVEAIYVEDFELALEKVPNEAVKNALIRLEKLSKIRSWKASIFTECVGLQHDLMIEPILKKLDEEKKILDSKK